MSNFDHDVEFDFYLSETSLDLRVHASVDRALGEAAITRIHPTCDDRLNLDVDALTEHHLPLVERMVREAVRHAEELWGDAA